MLASPGGFDPPSARTKSPRSQRALMPIRTGAQGSPARGQITIAASAGPPRSARPQRHKARLPPDDTSGDPNGHETTTRARGWDRTFRHHRLDDHPPHPIAPCSASPAGPTGTRRAPRREVRPNGRRSRGNVGLAALPDCGSTGRNPVVRAKALVDERMVSPHARFNAIQRRRRTDEQRPHLCSTPCKVPHHFGDR